MRRTKGRKRKKIILICMLCLAPIILFVASYSIFKLTLPNKITIEVGSNLESEYSTSNITLTTDEGNKVNTEKIGSYKIKYQYNYLFMKCSKIITVEVIDTVAPEFIDFQDRVEVYLNEEYQKDDYTVTDNYDTIENIQVEIRGYVDSSTIGEYYLTYVAIDASGNKTEKVRKISVSRKSPLELSNADFNLDSYFPDIILGETEDMGDDYMDKIYLAGDSVFWNFGLYNVFDASRVWAKPCTNPNNVYEKKVDVNNVQSPYTIPELIEKYKPEYVILSLGGCQSQSGDDEIPIFIEQYKKFLLDMQEVSTNTKFIVQSFAPVIELPETPFTNNTGRNKYNYYIAEMCEELNIPLLNISNLFKDENGSCKSDMCMSDGFHPNTKGMNAILEYIRTHGYKE